MEGSEQKVSGCLTQLWLLRERDLSLSAEAWSW